MKLLPNEELIITSNEDKIMLTNQRIQMTDSVWGQPFTVSIFLVYISSIEIKYKSNILLPILGAICVLGSFYMGGQGAGLVLGGIFFAVWWFTRKHIISISPDGGSSLNFMVQGMDDDRINDFVYDVSLAKQTRVNRLAKL
jgi:hypothetical protein